MKIKSIELDDDEMPSKVTVEMDVTEAAIIYGLTGTIAPRIITDLVGLDFGNAVAEVRLVCGKCTSRLTIIGQVNDE